MKLAKASISLNALFGLALVLVSTYLSGVERTRVGTSLGNAAGLNGAICGDVNTAQRDHAGRSAEHRLLAEADGQPLKSAFPLLPALTLAGWGPGRGRK